MKKNNIFVTRLARSAVASSLAACLVPQSHAEAGTTPMAAHGAAFNDQASFPDGGTQESTNPSVTFSVGLEPSEWDKGMEREFRKLALEEATGRLTRDQARRLEQLNRWRDRLVCPQTTEEILLQIKRDRLLARMEEVLNDYVEFQEATGKKRAAA
jgi:hypothetical protein